MSRPSLVEWYYLLMIGYWKFEKLDPTGPEIPWAERSLDMGYLSANAFGGGVNVSLYRSDSKLQQIA